MEMAQARSRSGCRPITGAELTLDDGSHLTLLCESRAGYRNLCRLITRAHERTRRWTRDGWSEPAEGRRPRQDPLEDEPAVSLADVERHAEGLVCLSGCARDGAAGAPDRGERPPRRRGCWASGCCAPSGPTASASSCSAPTGATTAAATGCSPSSPSGSACPASPPATCTPTSARARRCRTRWWRCGWAAALDETEPGRRGNSSHVLAPPERMAERFRDHPEAVAESGQAGRAAALRPQRGPRLPLPGRGGPGRRRQPGRDLPARGSPSATRAAPACAEAEARLDEELRVIRHLGLSGFFLLHRDMLELAREVAVEVRGPELGALGAAAGAGEGVERVLDRLLPHRPLARRPDRERAVPRPLPQRGADGAAGHRPRLPARHPRGADPARARALRPRPLRARRGVRHLPGALGGARLRQGARAAAGGGRAAGAGGRPLEAPERHRRRACRQAALAALGGARAGWRATRTGCRATSPSTRAGW